MRKSSHWNSEELFRGKTPEEWRALYAGAYDWGPDVGREIIEEQTGQPFGEFEPPRNLAAHDSAVYGQEDVDPWDKPGDHGKGDPG